LHLEAAAVAPRMAAAGSGTPSLPLVSGALRP
jgi:hypothetical protein